MSGGHRGVGNWMKLTSDQWVMEASQGYKLKLASSPEYLHIPTFDAFVLGGRLMGPSRGP